MRGQHRVHRHALVVVVGARVEIAQHAFGMPVRVGVPGDGLTGLADTVRRPQFATATGLALFAADAVAESAFGARLSEGAVGRAVAWLKEFF